MVSFKKVILLFFMVIAGSTSLAYPKLPITDTTSTPALLISAGLLTLAYDQYTADQTKEAITKRMLTESSLEVMASPSTTIAYWKWAVLGCSLTLVGLGKLIFSSSSTH